MNLYQMTELFAGGPGSGCQGPNCGRPKSSLQKMVEQASQLWGSQRNLWSLLARHGHEGVVEKFNTVEMKQLRDLTKTASRGECKVGMCFMNAQRIALASHSNDHVQLVEGLVTVYGVPIDHSWIEYDGKVYDPTLMRYKADGSSAPKQALKDIPSPEYFGVMIPKEEIVRHQMRTRLYSPLSHDWRDERLQKKIWGE